MFVQPTLFDYLETREVPNWYLKVKREHPGMLALFRVGNVYEAFGEDALAVKTALGIPVVDGKTGFPINDLARLLNKGMKVSITDS